MRKYEGYVSLTTLCKYLKVTQLKGKILEYLDEARAGQRFAECSDQRGSWWQVRLGGIHQGVREPPPQGCTCSCLEFPLLLKHSQVRFLIYFWKLLLLSEALCRTLSELRALGSGLGKLYADWLSKVTREGLYKLVVCTASVIGYNSLQTCYQLSPGETKWSELFF
jgi:hypothetical protein